MRRVLAPILVGLGAFLLVAAIVLTVWAPDKVKRTPTDVDSITYLGGQAQKINLKKGELESFPVKVASITRVDSKRSTDDVVVFSSVTCANKDEDLTEDCLKGKDPRLVSNSEDVFATDRLTAESVEDQARYIPSGSTPHEGLVNKWPFDSERKTYDYWDSLLKETVEAEYVRTTTVEGLRVYVYEVTVPPTETVIAGEDTKGDYSTEKSIYVEPKTGAIVNQTQNEIRSLPDGTKVLDLQVEFTEDQVKKSVEETEDSLSTLTLATKTGPLVGYILGGLLLIAGLVLLALSRRDRDES